MVEWRKYWNKCRLWSIKGVFTCSSPTQTIAIPAITSTLWNPSSKRKHTHTRKINWFNRIVSIRYVYSNKLSIQRNQPENRKYHIKLFPTFLLPVELHVCQFSLFTHAKPFVMWLVSSVFVDSGILISKSINYKFGLLITFMLSYQNKHTKFQFC